MIYKSVIKVLWWTLSNSEVQSHQSFDKCNKKGQWYGYGNKYTDQDDNDEEDDEKGPCVPCDSPTGVNHYIEEKFAPVHTRCWNFPWRVHSRAPTTSVEACPVLCTGARVLVPQLDWWEQDSLGCWPSKLVPHCSHPIQIYHSVTATNTDDEAIN